MSNRNAKDDNLLFFELQSSTSATNPQLRVSLISHQGKLKIISKTPGTEHYQDASFDNLERVCQWARAIKPGELVSGNARIGQAGWNLIVARESSHARQRNSLA